MSFFPTELNQNTFNWGWTVIKENKKEYLGIAWNHSLVMGWLKDQLIQDKHVISDIGNLKAFTLKKNVWQWYRE